MDGGPVVLLVGCVLVGSKKHKTGSNVRTCTISQPVDGTNNNLVNLVRYLRSGSLVDGKGM